MQLDVREAGIGAASGRPISPATLRPRLTKPQRALIGRAKSEQRLRTAREQILTQQTQIAALQAQVALLHGIIGELSAGASAATNSDLASKEADKPLVFDIYESDACQVAVQTDICIATDALDRFYAVGHDGNLTPLLGVGHSAADADGNVVPFDAGFSLSASAASGDAAAGSAFPRVRGEPKSQYPGIASCAPDAAAATGRAILGHSVRHTAASLTSLDVHLQEHRPQQIGQYIGEGTSATTPGGHATTGDGPCSSDQPDFNSQDLAAHSAHASLRAFDAISGGGKQSDFSSQNLASTARSCAEECGLALESVEPSMPDSVAAATPLPFYNDYQKVAVAGTHKPGTEAVASGASGVTAETQKDFDSQDLALSRGPLPNQAPFDTNCAFGTAPSADECGLALESVEPSMPDSVAAATYPRLHLTVIKTVDGDTTIGTEAVASEAPDCHNTAEIANVSTEYGICGIGEGTSRTTPEMCKSSNALTCSCSGVEHAPSRPMGVNAVAQVRGDICAPDLATQFGRLPKASDRVLFDAITDNGGTNEQNLKDFNSHHLANIVEPRALDANVTSVGGSEEHGENSPQAHTSSSSSDHIECKQEVLKLERALEFLQSQADESDDAAAIMSGLIVQCKGHLDAARGQLQTFKSSSS